MITSYPGIHAYKVIWRSSWLGQCGIMIKQLVTVETDLPLTAAAGRCATRHR